MRVRLTTQTASSTTSPRLRAFLLKKWKVPKSARRSAQNTGHEAALQKGIALLAEGGKPKLPKHLPFIKFTVPQQPFDDHLLGLSPLYVRARELFVESGGSFRAAMVSSPRSLGSPTLLESQVDYSPVESEYLWAATVPNIKERHSLDHLLAVRYYVTSIFHEQNHRTLWSMLGQAGLSAPRDKKALKRYLNLAESLIIGLDMALGDELGPILANLFYLTGATYDPGSTVRQEIGSRREYKNYLQAVSFATYLNLELYDEEQITRVVRALYPSLDQSGRAGPAAKKFAVRAAQRATTLDSAFVLKTNPAWQEKHLSRVSQALRKKGSPGLRLPDDPLDNREYYLFAERWFGAFGL